MNQRVAALSVQVRIPGTPTSVTATSTNGSVSITFTAPVQNGGSAITRYNVATASGPTYGVISGTTSPITFSGLSNGTYTFTVSATNAAGTSAASSASNAIVVQATGSSAFVQTSGTGFVLNGAAYKPVWGSVNGGATPANRVVAQAVSLNLEAVRVTDFMNTSGAIGVADRDEPSWQKVDAIIAGMAGAGLKTILDLSCYRNLLEHTSSTKPASPYTYDWSSFLSFVLNRVNTVSGLMYKSDPGIFYVAFAGETEAPNYGGATVTTAGLTTFFQTVSNYWVNQGGQQLLTPGGWLYMDDLNSGIDVASIAALPNINFVGIHAYSDNDRNMGIPNLAGFAKAAAKPWVNEECGQDITQPGNSDTTRAAYFTHEFEVAASWGVAGEGFWNIDDGTIGIPVGGYDVNTSGTPNSAAVISNHHAAGVSPATASSVVPITHNGSSLQISGSTKRFSGLNAYWLGLDDNNGGSPGTYPTHNQITNAIVGMVDMGVNLTRAHTIGISAGTTMSYQTDNHTFVDAHLDSADYAVYQAGLKGIYLMVPLTDNWNYYHGGLWDFVHWAYQQNSTGLIDVNGSVKDDHNNRQFFGTTTDQLRIRALFKNYINHWLHHVNPYTGLAYKDDPTIAIIETGNEIYYAAQTGSNEWTQDIAAYIKSIAPNKLVADGSAASGQQTSTMPGLTAAAVDIVGGHYYPQDASYNSCSFETVTPNFGGGTATTAVNQLANDVSAATSANRAFILGEYPWTRSDIATWYTDIQNNAGISGDLAWAFIANTDAGSPETHGSSFGSDDYPVHWPYSGSNETTYAPALANHIAAISGAAASGGSTVSGAPTGVTATGGNGSASVSFTTPSSNGGAAITSYAVTSAGPTVTTVSGSSSPITVPGLAAGSYTFTVKAVNSVGSSASSAASSAVSVAAAPSTTMAPLTRSGSHLQVSGTTTRLSGLNAYWVGLDDNNGISSGSFPSHTQITNAMAGMKAMGVNLSRTHTVGISTGSSKSYQIDGSTFSDANLDSADYAVYQAGLKGIYLMVPLTDNWNYYHGGLWNFVHWTYQQSSTGLTDVNGSVKDDHNNRQFFGTTTDQLRIRSLFKNYISHWLNHVNPYTGLAYKDDPTIAIIETGNEIYYAAQTGSNEWTQDIASYIKSIAPNKLVADGAAASGQQTSTMAGLTAAAVDIVGGHYYPQDASYNATTFGAVTPNFGGGTPTSGVNQLANDVSSAVGASRAFILGEYPWTRSDVSTWYSDVQANANISGDMAWSFVANTDAGSPETHGSSFGSDDYPIHWPYSGSNETTYAPALASHITAISGVSGGSGPATTNLLASTVVQHCSATAPFTVASATMAVDTTTYQEGGSSIKLTPSGSGVYPYIYPTSPSGSGAPVTAGSQYTGAASIRPTTTQSGGTAWSFSLVISFYTSSGSYISPSPSNQFQGSSTACPSGTWTQIIETATAPSNAAYAIVQPQAGLPMNAADIWNTDEHGLFAGSSATWTASG